MNTLILSNSLAVGRPKLIQTVLPFPTHISHTRTSQVINNTIMKSASSSATLLLSLVSYAAADFESANIEFIKQQQHESSSNKKHAVDTTTTAKKEDYTSSYDAPVGFEAANIEQLIMMQHYESSTNKKKDTDGDTSASNKEDESTLNEGPYGFEAANIDYLITQHYEMMNSQSSTQHR